MKRECEECGKEFEPTRPHQRWCKQACHDRYWNRKKCEDLKLVRREKEEQRWRSEFVYLFLLIVSL